MKLPSLLIAGAVLVSAFFELYAAAGPRVSDQSSTALLQAKPDPIAIDVTKMAVIVVDMQNDFGSKNGLFDLRGIDLSEIQKVVAPIANVVASARKAGARIIYLKMAFLPDLSDAGLPDSPTRIGLLRNGVGRTVRAPDGRESRVLIRETWNTDILDELKPAPEDIVIYKHRFSGFYQTELDAVLKKFGIRQLIVTGCTTSVCVESTVRDAMFHDYNCIVLADCTAEPLGSDFSRSNHEGTLFLVERRFGSVSTSADFIETLKTIGVRRTQ
jgi:ureidoacrylate peracid hydrolase